MPIYNARTTAAMSRLVQRIEAEGGTVLSVSRNRSGWEVDYEAANAKRALTPQTSPGFVKGSSSSKQNNN